MPVYEYACEGCGHELERIVPHVRADAAGACPRCEGHLRRRFSRIAVKLEGWGFSRNDGLVADRPGGRGDWAQVRDRAERIADGGT